MSQLRAARGGRRRGLVVRAEVAAHLRGVRGEGGGLDEEGEEGGPWVALEELGDDVTGEVGWDGRGGVHGGEEVRVEAEGSSLVVEIAHPPAPTVHRHMHVVPTVHA